MRHLQHVNLARFIGACVDQEKTAILMEYCPKGSLEVRGHYNSGGGPKSTRASQRVTVVHDPMPGRGLLGFGLVSGLGLGLGLGSGVGFGPGSGFGSGSDLGVVSHVLG